MSAWTYHLMRLTLCSVIMHIILLCRLQLPMHYVQYIYIIDQNQIYLLVINPFVVDKHTKRLTKYQTIKIIWILMVAKWLLIDGWWYFRLLINDSLLEFYSLWEIHLFWFPPQTLNQNSFQLIRSKYNYLYSSKVYLHQTSFDNVIR